MVEARKASLVSNPHGVKTSRIYDHENAQVIYMEMQPGQSLKKHITPVDVFFYILEGKVVVEIGDESREAAADTLVESPAGIPHRLMNEGGTNARLLVVKAPRQAEATRVL